MKEEYHSMIPPQPILELKKLPHQHKENTNMDQEQHQQDDDTQGLTTPSASKTLFVCNNNNKNNNKKDIALKELVLPASKLDCAEPDDDEAMAEDSGRERLKRHRVSVAGRVWIPEIWGQEDLLKDWIDCTAFDAPLVPSTIMMARSALIQEGRTATSGRIRIDNRC